MANNNSMHPEFLIIGQGISGTWLSYWLLKEGRTVHVIDDNRADAPSRVSAGVINPITGRRHVTVWMADQLFPFAYQHYHEMGALLGITGISEKKIIDFFPNPQMRQSFLNRCSESND